MKRLVYDQVAARRAAALEGEGAQLADLDRCIDFLQRGKALPQYTRDHELKGELRTFRSCVVGYTADERNVVMVYRLSPKRVYIVSVDEHDASYLTAIEVKSR